MSGALDCRKCGACCTSVAWNPASAVQRPFADMTDDEAEKLETKRPGLVTLCQPEGWTFEEPRFAMAIKKNDPRGRCVALTGTVGKRVSCSIYEDRPAGCRSFEPGGEECLEIRRKILGTT